MMPGTSPLTIVSFTNVARRCAALLNSRPVAILPPSLSDPDEILSVSPNSLAGPASATWWNLGAAQNYSGQQALLQSHHAKFSRNFRIHYANKLYSNSNMATESALEIDDIVLITDLSSPRKNRKISGSRIQITGRGEIPFWESGPPYFTPCQSSES